MYWLDWFFDLVYNLFTLSASSRSICLPKTDRGEQGINDRGEVGLLMRRHIQCLCRNTGAYKGLIIRGWVVILICFLRQGRAKD